MNKRIKKKQLYMKLEDVCDGIVKTLSVKNHSTIIFTVDPKKMCMYKGIQDRFRMIIDKLKNEHDITAIVVSEGAVVDVVEAGEIKIKEHSPVTWKE